MRIDPSAIKQFPKYHYKRLLYTLWSRLTERHSRLFFEEYALPETLVSDLPPAPEADWSDTQVLPEQARYLLWGLRSTENVPGSVVEVGSWRGVTTAYLAGNTSATVVAIDPWIGDWNQPNLQAFLARTARFSNIVRVRKAFGAAVRDWSYGPARFIFIDAVHDYANVAHDLEAARRFMVPGGIIALHDTDDLRFPGCRRAVYEISEQNDLAAHVDGLVLLRVRPSATTFSMANEGTALVG